MTGSVTQVAQTAHWTAVIATIAVSVCLSIAMGALAFVVGRDGSVPEVMSALGVMGNIATGLAVTLGLLVAGPQAVSAFIGRFQNVTTGAPTGTEVPPTAPPTS